MLVERRKWPDATKVLRGAVKHATNAAEWTKVVDAYSRLGAALRGAGETDEALRALGSAAEVATKAKLWDDVADAHLSRSAILAAAKRMKEAQTEREKAVALMTKVSDDEVRSRLSAPAAAGSG
jgi:tetratricopeptide (TPR) repeat protein